MIHPCRPRLKTGILAFSICLVQSCVDPVEPEFEYIAGLPYIDALLGTEPGTSYVAISESGREFGVNLNKPISGAAVFFINSDTGATVALTEMDETYLPPDSFAASEGETWELLVQMPDGKEYRSQPETVPAGVPISNLETSYDPELYFNPGLDTYQPGHRISVDFEDPAGVDNFYYWRYRSFEKLVHCRLCSGGSFLREGECKIVPPGSVENETPLMEYYTYGCEENCWQIRYNDKISIFSDEFSNGASTSNLGVADVLLYTKRRLLVQLQQFALTEDAYRYYRTLKDLIDNNSGFNAPLPAALIGNLLNPEDATEVILGRFTAAATTVMTITIERDFLEENPLEPVIISQPEGDETPRPPVFFAPCIESRFRTSAEPVGWEE